MPRRRSDHHELWEEYGRTRAVEDRNALVVAYLPLVQQCARKMMWRLAGNSQFDEPALVNAGVPGLMKAIENFDPQRGVYFSTFAALRIQGAILDELRNHDWVPRLVRKRAREGHCEQPAVMVPFALELDDQGDEIAYGQRFASPSAGPEERLAIEEFWRDQTRGLARSDRMILLLYFRGELTMKQIAETIGVCEARVSQRMAKLLQFLRSRSQAEGRPMPEAARAQLPHRTRRRIAPTHIAVPAAQPPRAPADLSKPLVKPAREPQLMKAKRPGVVRRPVTGP